MSRHIAFKVLFASVGVAALTASPAVSAPMQTWRVHADHVLGTSFDMAVTTASEAEASFAFVAAQTEISRLDRILSGWRSDSELSRLNTAGSHAASADLYNVVAATEDWRGRTGGLFDARLGEIEAVWMSAGSTPDARGLAEKALSAKADLTLDPATRTISRPDGVRIAPDGLAKGYIIDAALAAARRASPCAAGMLLDIGGDVRCFGVDALSQPWRVGVAAPGQSAENAAPAVTLTLRNAALAVSGPGPRDRMVEGAAISHLLNPVSGQPAARTQAAVIAARAVDADAAATALAVASPADALAMAERLPGIEAMIFAADGTVARTSGWSAFESSCQAALPAAFSVYIDFELPNIEVGKYRKPYTIVWITDADKNLVKTLLVTGAKSRWQESNYVWWRRYGRLDPDALSTIAKPTRAPGKYSLVWDGTNEEGKRVPVGVYTVNIETAREHGGHDYQSMPLTLGKSAVKASAPAAAELGAASARYAKK